MPALPPVPGVIKVALTGTLDLVEIATVFHMGYQGAPPTGQALEVAANTILDQWNTHMVVHMCNTTVYQLCTVTDLSSETGAVAVFEETMTGGAAGTAVPNNVQLVISKAIARRYRGGRPRTYIPGLPEAQLVSQTHWGSAFAVTIADAWAAFIQSITQSAGVPFTYGEVCVHYVKNDQPLVVPLVDATVGATARTLIGTLRRRLT